ncbi:MULTISPECIES: CBS domain-containing protein [Clostridium]|uniref:Inosine 5'-monophosphate dehydrogenase n=2 Tax=Clostridium TaxID=1485 RepID=A0A151APN1_9CLOT|nr:MULTISPECIES: CBS domain-containing protein [Clostridium]KYH29596.1 inosine 5'-monophosphate dehydrogenase [Clostridium colicanis DSM 13634]MBE6043900.1 CBS domain-containing protein [Clostridium thermopalmarium]PRR72045.1 inosine 5'-monophosphate dehydrogenase [Clostridium thermopalmarium DSM 5974]PVZ23697.1 CBS domain protein [Clostridium thermopalmarium DSM 5974]
MNIAFFLTPKKDVIYEKETSTMRQVLERMEYHRYTAIPIIDDKGKYIGTITEGDLLWKLKNTPDLNFKNTDKVKLKDIPRRMINNPVNIQANIEDLMNLAINQNFVPVVDDNGVFIGIIKRSEIISYYYKKAFQMNDK